MIVLSAFLLLLPFAFVKYSNKKLLKIPSWISSPFQCPPPCCGLWDTVYIFTLMKGFSAWPLPAGLSRLLFSSVSPPCLGFHLSNSHSSDSLFILFCLGYIFHFFTWQRNSSHPLKFNPDSTTAWKLPESSLSTSTSPYELRSQGLLFPAHEQPYSWLNHKWLLGVFTP